MRKLVFALLMLAMLAARAEVRVSVDKHRMMLYAIEARDTLLQAPVCLGMTLGQKELEGDGRTPEGRFRITRVEDSHSWTHDFGDGAGKRRGAYGPWFLRLTMPPGCGTGIGIHGTCFPESMGKRESEGCVRLLNRDLLKLERLVGVGTVVEISADPFGLENFDPLIYD